MAIDLTFDIVPTAQWPQGDARDPLGVWGGRAIITQDASGGSVKANFQAPLTIAGAYVYTCYSAQISNLSAAVAIIIKCRLLTNWPDVDPVNIGVQGYGSNISRTTLGDADFTAPLSGPNDPLVTPNDRYLLLFDPRPVAGAFTIVELEYGVNVDTQIAAFECWGYYWDRAVLQTPGGPRHPGSN